MPKVKAQPLSVRFNKEIQAGIEKRREELNAKYKDAELEAKNMELDMELAKKSEEMNKELNKYREEKLAEKKQREFDLDRFRMEKQSASDPLKKTD